MPIAVTLALLLFWMVSAYRQYQRGDLLLATGFPDLRGEIHLGLGRGDARIFLIDVGAGVIEPLQFRGRFRLGLAQRRQFVRGVGLNG